MWRSRPYIFQVRCHLTQQILYLLVMCNVDGFKQQFTGSLKVFLWTVCRDGWFSGIWTLVPRPQLVPGQLCTFLCWAGHNVVTAGLQYSWARWRPGSLGHLGVSCLYPWLFFFLFLSVSFVSLFLLIPTWPSPPVSTDVIPTLIIMWIMK